MHSSQLYGARERRTRPPRRGSARPGLRERRRETYLELVGEIEQRIDLGESAEQVTPIIRRRDLTAEQQSALELYAWAWEQTRPSPVRRLLVFVPAG